MLDLSFLKPVLSLISPIVTALKDILHYTSRLKKEREAGQSLFPDQDPRLIDPILDRTIARLRGEEIQDGWIRPLITALEHPIVTPHFLRETAVQGWLADDGVRSDLKALASKALLGTSHHDSTLRERLTTAYVSISGKPPAFADEAVNGIVAVLVAGAKSRLQDETLVVAGMIQETTAEHHKLAESIRQGFTGISEQISHIDLDEFAVVAHTEETEKSLSAILRRRGFLHDQARKDIQLLAQRVTSGNLRLARKPSVAKVLYWAARLCCSTPGLIDVARTYLGDLAKLGLAFDTRIVEAWILEYEGHTESALRILRDVNSSDGHSNLLLMLSRTKGREAAISWFDGQPAHNNSDFLTGIGWSNLAIMFTELGMWERAATLLSTVQSVVSEWPDLLIVEGVINAALLLPLEYRQQALQLNVFHPSIQVTSGEAASLRRCRAYECFRKAQQLMTEYGEHQRAQTAALWILWLRLTDEVAEVRRTAQDEVRTAMGNGKQAIEYLPFAIRFDIEFDKEPLKQYLAKRHEIGGLEGQELVAEFLLSGLTMTAAEYAEFLEIDEDRLSTTVPKPAIVGRRIEALLEDGQIARAKNAFDAHRSLFDTHDQDRLHAAITRKEGGDTRSELEANYARTNDLLDLSNLVTEVAQSRDWIALRPLLEELFTREPSIGNATRLLACLQRIPRVGAVGVKAFFDAHPEVSGWHTDLKSTRAWAAFYCGSLQEAQQLNDELLAARGDATDLDLDMNLAIQSGEWQRFPSIITREWANRERHDSTVLLRLARLAGEVGPNDQAFELAKLATQKAPSDPRVLIDAYSLGIQLGKDSEVDPTWMTRALELSGDRGPVTRIAFRKIVEEMVPAHRKNDESVAKLLRNGEIALQIATSVTHMPLARILLDLARRNKEQLDGRRRVILPIISGARQRLTIRTDASLGIDVTSVMVLHHLGLLDLVLGVFKHILLAPDIMIELFNERNRVRFHQPSQIRHAEEISDLIDKSRLKPLAHTCDPPLWLIEEVGRDLAELLHVAKESSGRVIHPRTIHKLASYLEQEADLRDYAVCILPMTDFVHSLFREGKIDKETFELGVGHLSPHDGDQPEAVQTETIPASPPFYLSNLAATYFQQAGILQAVCHSGVDLWVQESVKDDLAALKAASREGDRLANDIDEIRNSLKEGLAKGTVVFLPRHKTENLRTGSMAGFLADSGGAECVCIDDRFMNQHSSLTDMNGRTVPLACTLDILSCLAAAGIIDNQKKWIAIHKLRAAGFALIPIEADELTSYLREINLDSAGKMIERQELRIMRQMLMRIRSISLLQYPLEQQYLSDLWLACVMSIRRLWKDDAVSVERARILSDWIWAKLTPLPFDWIPNSSDPSRNTNAQEVFCRIVASLLSPMGRMNIDKFKAFLDWVEQTVLQPLLPANRHLIDALTTQLQHEIEQAINRLTNAK